MTFRLSRTMLFPSAKSETYK